MVTLQEAAKRKRLNLKVAAGTAVAIGSILGATNHMREVKHEWNQGMALTADLLTLTGVAVLAWSW